MIINGLRNIFSTLIPLKMKRYVNCGTLAVIINISASASAALIPFTSGIILDKAGWVVNYAVVIIFCFITLAALIYLGVKDKKHMKKQIVKAGMYKK